MIFFSQVSNTNERLIKVRGRKILNTTETPPENYFVPLSRRNQAIALKIVIKRKNTKN